MASVNSELPCASIHRCASYVARRGVVSPLNIGVYGSWGDAMVNAIVEELSNWIGRPSAATTSPSSSETQEHLVTLYREVDSAEDMALSTLLIEVAQEVSWIEGCEHGLRLVTASGRLFDEMASHTWGSWLTNGVMIENERQLREPGLLQHRKKERAPQAILLAFTENDLMTRGKGKIEHSALPEYS